MVKAYTIKSIKLKKKSFFFNNTLITKLRLLILIY